MEKSAFSEAFLTQFLTIGQKHILAGFSFPAKCGLQKAFFTETGENAIDIGLKFIFFELLISLNNSLKF